MPTTKQLKPQCLRWYANAVKSGEIHDTKEPRHPAIALQYEQYRKENKLIYKSVEDLILIDVFGYAIEHYTDHNGQLKIQAVRRTGILPCKLEHNRFPYLTTNCVHLTFWTLRPLNIDRVKEILKHELNTADFVIWQNNPNNQSVKAIQHYHIMVGNVPAAKIPSQGVAISPDNKKYDKKSVKTKNGYQAFYKKVNPEEKFITEKKSAKDFQFVPGNGLDYIFS